MSGKIAESGKANLHLLFVTGRKRGKTSDGFIGKVLPGNEPGRKMNITSICTITCFWAMQIVAQLIFKWGTTADSRWMLGFLGGNLFGFSSIWLLMLVYKSINPNIALGICGGGSFLFSQIALAGVFRSSVSIIQWGGVLAIVMGMLLLAMGKSA